MGNFCNCVPPNSKGVSKQKKKHYLYTIENCNIESTSYSNYSLANEVQGLKPLKQRSFNKKNISLDDFELIQILGKGSYGTVYLIRHNSNGKLYAMKELNKSDIRRNDHRRYTHTERYLLEKIKHPFIIHLLYAFQNETSLFLITSFMQGGDLFHHLKKEKFFSQHKVKFYAAEIILALSYLHENNCIYRDLKPENILLDAKGHIKLTDFGLSKRLHANRKAFSICGTPIYLAPEILKGKGYDFTVDWWSLGVLIYQMLSGYIPFNFNPYEELSTDMYKYPIKMCSHFSIEAKDLIQKLLSYLPEGRLGYRGVDEIKRHPFFKGINWNDCYNKNIPVPFKPNVTNEMDLCYFEKFKCNSIKNESIDTIDKVIDNYDEFTFIGDEEVQVSKCK